MNKSPAFQFYPDKWMSHTGHLNDTAYRIFHEMICWMWQHSDDRCSMPSDPAFIAIALRTDCERIANALRSIQNEHMPLLKVNGDRFVSNGLKKEAVKQRGRRKQASDAAKRRWHSDLTAMPEHSVSNADASIQQCTPSPTLSLSPIPSSKENKKPPIPPKGGRFVYSDSFEKFWKAYPRKTGKGAAFKAWGRARAIPAVDDLIAAIDVQKISDQWTKDQGAYIPHPATWINERRWEDEGTEPPKRVDSFGREY